MRHVLTHSVRLFNTIGFCSAAATTTAAITNTTTTNVLSCTFDPQPLAFHLHTFYHDYCYCHNHNHNHYDPCTLPPPTTTTTSILSYTQRGIFRTCEHANMLTDAIIVIGNTLIN